MRQNSKVKLFALKTTKYRKVRERCTFEAFKNSVESLLYLRISSLILNLKNKFVL